MPPSSTVIEEVSAVDELFDRIEVAVAQKPDEHARLRIAKLQRIVDEASANEQVDESEAHVALVNEAVEVMSANVQEPLTIVQIAAECGVSPTLLKQTFKSVVGVPVYQWYRSHRLVRACQLLSDTDLPITKVSMAVGYSNASKFAKAFREETGCSPRDWRNAHPMES